MFQFVLTPAAGKRLIAKAVVIHPSIEAAIHSGTIVVVAGTTNGYIAEELLTPLKQAEGFHRNRFLRGVTVPPHVNVDEFGRLPDESQFLGDVVIQNGMWQKGKTIFDVVDNLKDGDVIVKGANCVDLKKKRAGVLIGHPKGGTIAVALQAVIGRRVKLLIPAGVEKRVSDDIDTIAANLNSPGCTGLRLMPVPGEVVTEIEAIHLLTGANAMLVAAGGVYGAEGAVRFAIDGARNQIEKAKKLLEEVASEPPFSL
jgi:hypothetical protein